MSKVIKTALNWEAPNVESRSMFSPGAMGKLILKKDW